MNYATGVIGASGYAGGELLRLLASHPEFAISAAAAHSNAGQSVTSVHPHLTSFTDMTFIDIDSPEIADLDVMFLALPHGASAALTSSFANATAVVDLGADHRLVDPAEWERYYGGQAAPAWTYGLPELPGRRKMIRQSRRVANPGCYATAIQLASAPLLAAGIAQPDDIVVVAGSGTSGAGRSSSARLLATEVMGSLSAYKVGGTHQHIAEVSQELSALAGTSVSVSFTPMLVPMPRGILATVTMRPAASTSTVDLRAVMSEAYRGEPFVRLLPEGDWPSTAMTGGSNMAVLQVAYDERADRIVALCAIDNLGKGAASQAIQNANLMCGLPEATGLPVEGIAP